MLGFNQVIAPFFNNEFACSPAYQGAWGGYIGHVEEYDMPPGGHGWYLILTWTKGKPKIADKELRVGLCTYITRPERVLPECDLIVVEDTMGQKMERVFTGMQIDSR
jgi:hypothetical protein